MTAQTVKAQNVHGLRVRKQLGRLSTVFVLAGIALSGGSASAGAPGDEGDEPVPVTSDVSTARTSGPRLELDRTEVEPGRPVIVTLSGFTSQQATVAVCGNLAKRGATDCNMPSAQSERIRDGEPFTLTQLFAEEPPVPCPCVVRAVGTDGEFAITPIDLIGHPTGPLVSPEFGELIEVSLSVVRAEVGFADALRSQLAGSAPYDVTVSVRNVATERLDDVEVRAAVSHRIDDDVADVRFDRPGPIEPGQTWTQTVEATLPVPHVGRYTWSAAFTGAGPTVEASATTDAVPVVLYVLLGILLLDLLVIAIRVVRRRRRRARARAGSGPADHGDRPGAWSPDPRDAEAREPVSVGS